MSGRNFKVDLKNMSATDIARHANTLADGDGRKRDKLQQPIRTRTPSIQGNWTPFHPQKPVTDHPVVGRVIVRQKDNQ